MQINAGPPVTGADYFNGRLSIVQELATRLSSGDILLVGPRRTGKTSAAKEYIAQEKKKDPNFCASFVDLEEIESLYEFYARIAKAIYDDANKIGALTEGAKKALKSTSNLLSDIFPGGIDLSAIPGAPKLLIKAPKFDPPKVAQLREQTSELLLSLDRPFTIVLDEFPEAIWKFGKNEETLEAQVHQRKEETRFLLEGLRTIRQLDQGTKNHRTIVAGSINLKNTLEHLELSQLINDLPDMTIPYLIPAQSVELFHQLSESEGFSFESGFNADEFIRNRFGKSSPFYIQFFAERLRQLKFEDTNLSAFGEMHFKSAFFAMIMDPRGPAYLQLRLKRYYSAEERAAALALFENIASHQFNNRQLPTEAENFLFLKEKKSIELPRLKQAGLIAKLNSDNLIEHSSEGKWHFACPVICSYWHYNLVEDRYL